MILSIISVESSTGCQPLSATSVRKIQKATREKRKIKFSKNKRIFELAFLLAVILLFNFKANAQFEFGGSPSSLKWRQVKSKTATVIYPQGLDSVAQRVENIVSYFQPNIAGTIGKKYRPINFVLQNQTTISNGFVQLAPYRSEFFLTPLQNSFEVGSLPWPDALAIHEFRHVTQVSNFNVGLAKVMYLFLGEQGQELANDLAIPNWFSEGDAVFNETQTSWQGRGRLPYFFNDFRSLWQEQKNYSWMKLRNGSLRDYTPDHYRLGYMLIAYGREKYGEEYWKKVAHDAACMKGVFYSFQRAVKRHSHESYKDFRNDALAFMHKQLVQDTATIATSKHFLGDQEFPNYLNDGRLLYVNSSYKQVPYFVINDNGVEKKLRVRDISLDNYYSVKNDKIVYASYRPDIRWGNRDYSEIKLLDVNTGVQRTVTHKTKYFSPDINDNGSQIVAVGVFPDQRSELHILDANSGNVEKIIPNSRHLFYTYPKFYKSKEIIAAVRDGKGEMTLMKINIENNEHTALFPFSQRVIGFPQIKGDTVFFTASEKDKDELFALVVSEAKVYRLQSPLLKGVAGNYQMAASNGKLVWTNFTAVGMRLREATNINATWVSVNDFSNFNKYDFGITALSNKPTSDLLDKVRDSISSASKYPKGHRLFNFHSWKVPVLGGPDYRFELSGENVLGNFQSDVYFNYNSNESSKKIGVDGIYAGLFPYFTGGVSYTFNRNSIGKHWNEMEASAGVGVPFNLSKGRHFTSLNVGSFYTYNNSYFLGAYKQTIGTVGYAYLNNTVNFSNSIQSAKQNIYPRFAQTLSLNYKTAVQKYTAKQFLANCRLYWPGLFTNHSFVVDVAFQARDADTLGRPFTFVNSFPFSRGFQAENLYRMYKWGANYHLPLCYPDWGFASLLYFQRIRANLFFDYTITQDFSADRTRVNQNFRSTGTEIFFDTKVLNAMPISLCIRYSRLLDVDKYGGTGHNRWNVVVPITL